MGKKREKDARGEALLTEWGVTADPRSLGAAWGRDPAADLAIAWKLGHLPDPSSVAVLVDLETRTSDKSLRKEIRRSLFRLSQRGIAVPTPQEPPAPKTFTLGGPALEGFLSPSDGDGNLLVWLVKGTPNGILHLFALVNDPRGMLESGLSRITRKALRSVREDLFEKHAIRFVDADWRYCDWRMWQAFEWARQHGTAVSGDFPRERSEIVREPAQPIAHPIFAKLDAESVRAETVWLQQSPEMLSEPELRTWLLPEETLRPHLQALDEAASSPLVLNKYQQEDRARGVLAAAMEELFGGEQAASFSRRLLDLALVFHATQRSERARQALATALALEAGGSGQGVPFCEALLHISLSIRAKAAAESETQQRTLIVTPQEAREAATRRHT